jgi:hypothetical protein
MAKPVIRGSTVILMSLLVLMHAEEVTIRLYHVLAVSAMPGRSSAEAPDMLVKVLPLGLFIHW